MSRLLIENKEIQKKLQETIDFNEKVFESSSLGIVVYKESGQCVLANETSAQIIGATKKQVLSQNFKTIKSWHNSGLLKTAEESIKSNKGQTMVAFVTSTFGKPLWLDCFFCPFIMNNKKQLLLIFEDITKKKNQEQKLRESEERFKIAAQCASDLVYEWDINTDRLEWYGAIDRALGFERNEFPRTLTAWLQRIHPADKRALEAAVTHRRKEIDPINVEYRISKKDGSYCYWIDKGIPIFDKNNKHKRIIGVCTDITEKINAEKERSEIQKKLYLSSKLASIGILAAGVAHEINNPLSIIKWHIEKLIDDEPDRIESLKAYNKIDNAVDRIAKIVKDLKIYASSHEEGFKEVDIHKVIDMSIQFVKEIFEKENVIFKKIYKAESPITQGNEGKTQQIFIDLFSNARDAKKENGSIITISTYETENNIIIEISDTGIGIKEKDLDKIFDPFFTTKEIGKGTGLGLGIVGSIVRTMNGDIELKSDESKGTCVKITLPKVDIDYEINEKYNEDENKIFNGKVLLVEDEDDLRNILFDQLTELGLEVDIATDGYSAINKIRSTNYNLIITDLKMPGMDGYKMIENIKDNKLTHAKIIVITGSINAKDNPENIRIFSSISGFIEKPFNKKVIMRHLEKCLNPDKTEKKYLIK